MKDIIFCSDNIINRVLNGIKDCIYLSEADFQFTFARSLNDQEGVSSVILEYPILCKSLYNKACDNCKKLFKDNDRSFIDLYFKYNDVEYFIEFKYKLKEITANGKPYEITRHIECNDKFTIKNQGAIYIGRHEIYEDIERMENIRKIKPNANSFVILVTNEQAYWKSNQTKQDSTTYNFPLSDNNGRSVTNCCNRGLEYNTKSKSKPRTLFINKSYKLQWNNFKALPENPKNGEFRILVIECN